MSDIKNRHLIETQIPYHIREQNPLFVKFLEYYYEFLEDSKINSITQDVLDYNNSDKVDLDILQQFYEEIKELPTNIQVDKRLLATRIYDLYKAKGSEDSLKLLFRLAFNENIAVAYPQENILRASDGRWVRDVLITFQLNVDETFDSAVNTVVIQTNVETFRFKITKIETDIPDRYRIYFDARQNFTLDINQEIKLYIDDTEVCTGFSTVMVSSAEIITNGTDWQKGQIIVISGTNKDTILQVDSVNYTGTIQKFNIIQYGDGHDFSQVYTFSPFEYTPSNEYSEYFSLESNSITGARAHYLDVGDFAISKSVSQKLDFNDNGIISSIPNIESDAITNNNIVSYSGFIDTASSVTLDQWLSSRLKIRLKSSNIAFLPGYYSEEKSLISSYFSKLQDNEFYQIFSYVIETAKTLSEYLPALNLIHPAGIKHFSKLVKQLEYTVGIVVDRILSQNYLLLDESFSVSEDINFDITKEIETDISVPENPDFVFEKNYSDDVASASEDIEDFDIIKVLSDSANAIESITNEPTKELSDTANALEDILLEPAIELSDSVNVIEITPVRNYEQELESSVSATDFSLYVDVDYIDINYFDDYGFKYSIAREISDSITGSEAIDDFIIEKDISDTISVIEDATIELTKELLDSISGAEGIDSFDVSKDLSSAVLLTQSDPPTSAKYIDDNYVNTLYVDLEITLNN